MLTALLACTASSITTCANADASVVFDNGGPDFRNGYVSDTDYPFQQAGDFVLRDGFNTLTAVRFWGSYAFADTPPISDDFKIRFFLDDGGKPAVDWLFEFPVGDIDRTSLGLSTEFPIFEYFRYETDIPGITLDAEKTYWLSVINSTPEDKDDNWYWARSKIGGYWKNRAGDGVVWDDPRFTNNSVDHYELAFQLIGVPEPSYLALVICGVAVMSGRAIRVVRA